MKNIENIDTCLPNNVPTLIFAFGQEQTLVQQLESACLSKLKPKHHIEVYRQHFHQPEDWAKLVQLVSGGSLLNTRLFLTIYAHASSMPSLPALLAQLLTKPPQDKNLLIALPETWKNYKKPKWLPDLSQHLCIDTCAPAPWKRYDWLFLQSKKRNLALSKSQLDAILFSTNGQLDACESCLEKLELLNAEPISQQAIEACLSNAEAFNAFQLFDSALSGKLTFFIKTYRRLQPKKPEQWQHLYNLTLGFIKRLTALKETQINQGCIKTFFKQHKLFPKQQKQLQSMQSKVSLYQLEQILEQLMLAYFLQRGFSSSQANLMLFSSLEMICKTAS
jgi:DNA polymerase III delta subunit